MEASTLVFFFFFLAQEGTLQTMKEKCGHQASLKHYLQDVCDNGGTELVEVANQYLVKFEANAMRGSLFTTQPEWPGIETG